MTELEFEIFMDENYGAVKKTMPVIYEHLRNIERVIKHMDDVTFDPSNMSDRNMASQVSSSYYATKNGTFDENGEQVLSSGLRPEVREQMAPRCGCGIRECGICRGQR